MKWNRTPKDRGGASQDATPEGGVNPTSNKRISLPSGPPSKSQLAVIGAFICMAISMAFGSGSAPSQILSLVFFGLIAAAVYIKKRDGTPVSRWPTWAVVVACFVMAMVGASLAPSTGRTGLTAEAEKASQTSGVIPITEASPETDARTSMTSPATTEPATETTAAEPATTTVAESPETPAPASTEAAPDTPQESSVAAQAQAAQEDRSQITVYTTNTGGKYHTSVCSYLRKSKIPISLGDAVAQGLEPCAKCHPPTL